MKVTPSMEGLQAKEIPSVEKINESKIEVVNTEKLDAVIKIESRGYFPRIGGEWSGEVGNSDFIPDRDFIPGDRNGTNPEGKTWGEILDEHGIDDIPFKDGEVDFSEVSKDEVKIDDFTIDRSVNFDQADEKLAVEWGGSPEEVFNWREDNKHTWHECKDCETMQLVPREVHGNIPHSGGIAEQKFQDKNTQ